MFCPCSWISYARLLYTRKIHFHTLFLLPISATLKFRRHLTLYLLDLYKVVVLISLDMLILKRFVVLLSATGFLSLACYLVTSCLLLTSLFRILKLSQLVNLLSLRMSPTQYYGKLCRADTDEVIYISVLLV